MCLNVLFSILFILSSFVLQISFHFSDTLIALSVKLRQDSAPKNIYIYKSKRCVCWEARELT